MAGAKLGARTVIQRGGARSGVKIQAPLEGNNPAAAGVCDWLAGVTGGVNEVGWKER